MSFKLTYSTMFDPPEELHTRFEAALAEVRAGLGARHELFIAGRDVPGAGSVEKRSPVDTREVLGQFAVGDGSHVERAMQAAAAAFPAWRATPLAERVRRSRRVADLIEARVYQIAAALCLDVGKNRMEALGEVQEAADFFRGYADEFERNAGYDRPLPDDPLRGFRSHNRSVLKPYGVWLVISPFNFPLALAAGPVAAALVTGNTVVAKGASATPWAVRLLADCMRDAGYPDGVFNYLAGDGDALGAALVGHPAVAGLTFTGSHEVGMRLARQMLAGSYPRPCIAEMGGKNACIVTRDADVERAATGIVRSAFGLGGQKCSALSRVYVADAIADGLIGRIREQTRALRIGDPARRENWLGPVISARAVQDYGRYCERLHADGGEILCGGKRMTDGGLAAGYFVAPTLAEAPLAHPLFGHEMFLPILMVARITDLKAGVAAANASSLGLTAGCYGSREDVDYFLEHIEAGTTYSNRPQGATTGAWPGYQAFAGWKGSASTGKAIGSFYYLPQYLREQSQTVVE
jgi:acyl-CoA reductase-like NAD-dependent aldehyde dehydrogenase